MSFQTEATTVHTLWDGGWNIDGENTNLLLKKSLKLKIASSMFAKDYARNENQQTHRDGEMVFKEGGPDY